MWLKLPSSDQVIFRLHKHYYTTNAILSPCPVNGEMEMIVQGQRRNLRRNNQRFFIINTSLINR